MIICHRHKFIFIKNHKVAGTSIEIALSRMCDDGDVLASLGFDEPLRKELAGRGRQNHLKPLWQYSARNWRRLLLRRQPAYRFREHASAREIRGLIPSDIWNTYFKFCFERNPWDKAVSDYWWWTRKPEQQQTISTFLRSERFQRRSDFENYTQDGQLLVDYVGQYANLQADLDYLAERLQLPSRLELPRAKGSHRKDRRHYSRVLNEADADLIAQQYAREIEMFGYQFDRQLQAA